MKIIKTTNLFGKTKYHVYHDGKKLIKFALDYASFVPGSDLLLIQYKGKCNVVDSSIMGQPKSQVINDMRYKDCLDFGSFIFLVGEDDRRLKFVDKKTKREISVDNGLVYWSGSDRFIVYCDLSNEYRAVLNTSKGMDTYTLPDMKTNYCVQYLFDFCGDYLNSAHLIASTENPRRVYKIMRDFLKRLLQDDIANFDKATLKYFMPD